VNQRLTEFFAVVSPAIAGKIRFHFPSMRTLEPLSPLSLAGATPAMQRLLPLSSGICGTAPSHNLA
jgi:hypothetical protein